MILFKKILKWTVIVLVGLFILAEIIRLPFRLREEKTVEQVAKIHNTKLQLSDVMGENLPPDPGAEADKTVQGIDANTNGIRDDVELAIFKEYPNSAKTRAVLLQYALALQMQVIQPIINKDTVTEVVREQSRAFVCIGDIVSRENSRKFDEETNFLTDFIKQRQLNTEERKNSRNSFLEYISSYNSLERTCDIDYSTLPN